MLVECIFCNCCYRDRDQVSEALQLGREAKSVIAARFQVTEAQLDRHRICLGLDEAPAETKTAEAVAE